MVVLWEGTEDQAGRLLGEQKGHKAGSLKRSILKARQQRIFTIEGLLDGGWGRVTTRLVINLMVFLSVATIVNGFAQGERTEWFTPAVFGIAILAAYYLTAKGIFRPLGWLLTAPFILGVITAMTAVYAKFNF